MSHTVSQTSLQVLFGKAAVALDENPVAVLALRPTSFVFPGGGRETPVGHPLLGRAKAGVCHVLLAVDQELQHGKCSAIRHSGNAGGV